MSQQTLNVSQLLMIFPGHKTGSPACGLHPGRSADTMHIILWAIGQIEVNNMPNVGDIDTAGRDISGNQYPECAALESFERRTTLRQATVSVQDSHPMSLTSQGTAQSIGAMLGPSKDEDRILVLS